MVQFLCRVEYGNLFRLFSGVKLKTASQIRNLSEIGVPLVNLFAMNPITSTIAGSCSRLALSPRSSPRNSPRSSPNALRKPPFLDIPDDRKRRDSKEIEDYKRKLAQTTSKAYKANKRTENKKSYVHNEKVNARTTKEKPPKRLSEEAFHTATAEKHGKKKTANVKASSSASKSSKQEKSCTIM